MSRTKGTLGLSSNIEPSMNAPLDGREVTGTLADLTTASTFPYFYEGMKVYVKSEHKTYQLVGSDPTVAANWKVEGSDITIDSTPTAESTNAVSSGGVYAELEEKADLVNGKIPASQLPSYVDDVIEGYYKEADGKFYEESTYETEIPGEAGKSFVDKGANKSYRWTGSAFVRVDEGVSLGETSTTAYRGDRGKTAYEDSQANKQHIGDLTQLQTVEKTNLVGAINEAAQSGGGGHTIKNNAGTALTQRANLQFGGDLEVSDDSENDETEVAPHRLTSEELADICSPLPASTSNLPVLFDESGAEYVVGRYVNSQGKWKPVYEKTVILDSPNNAGETSIFAAGIVDTLVDSKTTNYLSDGYSTDTNTIMYNVNNVNGTTLRSEVWQNNTTKEVYLFVDKGSNVTRTLSKAVVTIRYTKTTDTYQD